VDLSHPLHHDQMEVVNKTLVEIGAGDKTQIILFNKVDRIKPLSNDVEENGEPDRMDIQQLLNSRSDREVYISATKKLNIDLLREVLLKEVRKAHLKIYPNYLMPETH